MLHLLAALVLLFFLPGWTFVNALFPRRGEIDREYDTLYRVMLGIVMSVVVVILYGFGLNSLGVDPGTGFGYVTGTNLWVGLTAITLLFFIAGWWRGAYPRLGKIHPKLARLPSPEKGSMVAEFERDRKTLAKLRELSAEREKLRRQIRDYERRISLHTGDAKTHYVAKRDEARGRLREIDAQLRAVEKARAEELYGA